MQNFSHSGSSRSASGSGARFSTRGSSRPGSKFKTSSHARPSSRFESRPQTGASFTTRSHGTGGTGFKPSFRPRYNDMRSAPSTGSSDFSSSRSHSASPAVFTTSSHGSFSNSKSKPSSNRGGSSSFSFGGRSSGGSRFGGGSRGGRSFGGGGRGGGGRSNRGGGERIDAARFVNKAVETEEVENFIPENNFADFQIIEQLKSGIIAKGYQTPTPIQDKAIPHVLAGSDVVGIANTGTGKTGAFLIPLIHKVLMNRKEQVMIIAPTRELAIQIDAELKAFTAGMKIFSVCCVGGASIGKQLSELRYQYNFIIGTPGRIKDLIDRKRIILSEFKSIVLDEADRMLDMGFVDDMRSIMNGMPKERHTLFFSATLSHDIEKLIKEFLREPVRISVKTRDTAKNVDQDVVRVGRGENKIEILHELLNKPEFTKVLVFGRTKHGVERISVDLIKRGFKAESIHGDKNHVKRQKALRSFKDNFVQVLVATDVAARGLDIPDVTHVINYDIPATYDDYVHRIGRTGRGNKKGKALTFIG